MEVEDWLGPENQIGIDNWKNKYQFAEETFEDWLKRVSGEDEEVARLIREKKFLFGGRVLANRGLGAKGKKTTYSNCYVLPACEDNLESIFSAAGHLARTYSYGGGCGIDLSKLAPRGAKVNNAANTTSGALTFAELYNTTTGLIGQAGRRGALMLSLSSEHPDLEEFITAKTDLTKLTKANLSLRVSDKFMRAVIGDRDHELSFTRETGETIQKIVNAGEMFTKIVESNWNFGEPGFLFWDRVKSWSFLSNYSNFAFAGTNPCGEEPLPAWGSCNLGSFNLVAYFKNGSFDWISFLADIPVVVRAMNNVLDENMLLHPLPEQRKCAAKWRPIGIGIMGFADLLIKLRITYGSQQSIDLASKIGAKLIDRAVLASAQLAEKEGPFPEYNKLSTLISDFYRKNVSRPVDVYVQAVGIRNSQILCIAPTGTLATMLGISSGMEPIFATQYERRTESLHGMSVKYKVYTPIVKEVIDELNDPGAMLPEYIVTAGDISPRDRVRMQAAWQQHIDAAISSTVNLPNKATLDDVKNIYIEAWEHGLKGITVFRDGCARLGVLTIGDVEEVINTAVIPTPKLERGVWKKCAKDTKYEKVKVKTGCGKLTIMVGYSRNERALQDFYVIRSGTGGCERTIQDLVIAMSAVIRLGGKLENLEKGFDGIGTCNSFTAVRVKGLKMLSPGNNCGEAILNAIRNFCKTVKEEEEALDKGWEKTEYPPEKHKLPAVPAEIYGLPVMISQGICPECSAIMVAESGCFTCKSCGSSRCG